MALAPSQRDLRASFWLLVMLVLFGFMVYVALTGGSL